MYSVYGMEVVGIGDVRWEGWEGWDWEGWKAVVEEEGEEVWVCEGEGERRERRLGSLDLEALISRSTLCVGGWLDGVGEELS